MFDSDLIQRFVRTIARHTGLLVRPQDESNLKKKIQRRMSALKLSSAQDYYRLLTQADGDPFRLDNDTVRSRREWQELIHLLVVTESYFFRDRGQFDLLRSRILPELIIKKRNLAARDGHRPSLKLWSAACASGEEPYSLAVLVWELLGDRQDWDIFILGTDISGAVLSRARRGEYNQWSFRQVDERIKQKYFQQHGDRYHLNPEIRQLVSFRSLNLVADEFPDRNTNLCDIDLILCRNVFIYFERTAIERTLDKFYRTLAPGGYLIAAHAELQGYATQQFHTQLFPQSVVYQRCDRLERAKTLDRPPSQPLQPHSPSPAIFAPAAKPTPPIPPLTPNKPPVLPAPLTLTADPPPTPPSTWTDAIDCFRNAAYGEAIRQAERFLGDEPRHLDAYILIARAYANLGDYQKATYYCMQALELDSLAVAPHYLLAHLCELQGNASRAKNFLKKIVYIDPNAALAYLELAQIYRSEGDLPRARKMQSSAVEILRSLSPSAPVDRDGQLTAGELLQQMEN